MIQLALIPFCAFLNRVRGGLFGPVVICISNAIKALFGVPPSKGATQLARAIFAIGMGVAMWAATNNILMLVSILLWVACEFLPNGDYLGASNIWQDLEASAVGIGNVSLPALLFAFTGRPVAAGALIIAGICKGPLYKLAQYIPSKISGFQQGAEMAEFLFGMILGCALYAGYALDFYANIV
jgi:hypothetical protein